MRAGRLRDKIRLEKPVKVKNPATGSIATDWKLVVVRSAQILAVSSAERNDQSSETYETNTIINLRYDRAFSEISGEWRVVDQRTGRVYEIESFTPIASGMKDIKIRCIHRSK